jgi:hypothetical protein
MHRWLQGFRRTPGGPSARFSRVRTMPRRAFVFAATLACTMAGCGGESDYANKPRPATPINVTAAIDEGKISISPKTFGAGPIVMIVSNQTGKAQTVTLETDELGGTQPGLTQSTDPVDPRGTGTLKVDVREGDYSVSVKGAGIEPAAVKVGRNRKSAQDDLLEP